MTDLWKVPPGSDIQTFKYDSSLPSLPIPSLNYTLTRYLDSVRPFLNDTEFANTQEIVEKFANGEGKELHQLLSQKAANLKNWVEEWWESYAYLESRQSLIPFSSMIGISSLDELGWTHCPGQMIRRCALHLYCYTEIWQLLRTQRWAPALSADGKTRFSMSQFRRFFNCNRTPLPKRDRLDTFFKTEAEGSCPSHVIFQCNGQLYMVDAIDPTSGVPLSIPEWELQVHFILLDAENNPGPGLGRLTCDNRDIWAENRLYLQRLTLENSHYLDFIDTALFIVTLDADTPQTDSEVARSVLCGDYANRWADKSLSLTVFKNGMISGISENCSRRNRNNGICDRYAEHIDWLSSAVSEKIDQEKLNWVTEYGHLHTAFDGLVSITAMTYTFERLRELDGMDQESQKLRLLKKPKRLDFALDNKIRDELVKAQIRQEPYITSVLVAREKFPYFGKKAITKHRIHPDTFVQMALQFAYYSLHGRLAPCYETATTRAYYNGRTETHRPCTIEVADWVYAMNGRNIKAAEKLRLMRVAAKKNDELMKLARENHGCDRHLFGLYCIALESGRPIPELFKDPAYAKSGGGGNFILSTSLVGYYPAGGGVTAMTKDGYGIFYNFRPDSIYFTITAQREGETSTNKYSQMLTRKLLEMMELLESTASISESKSKL